MKQLSHNETPTSQRAFPITVLCDGISLPANIGAIFRLADAFGVERVIFGGSNVDVSSRKVRQVSRSTHKWVVHDQAQDLVTEISKLKEDKVPIIAIEITDNSCPIQELRIKNNQKIAILIGSEINGISQKALNLSDEVIHIPIFGKNSSINVSNTLAIVLYDIVKQFHENTPQ